MDKFPTETDEHWNYFLLDFPVKFNNNSEKYDDFIWSLKHIEFTNFLDNGVEEVLWICERYSCKVVVSLVGVNGILIQYLDLL